ncbi:MAG: hypothetical protein ACYCWW_12130 [Deltaproteobacteria bacterium]
MHPRRPTLLFAHRILVISAIALSAILVLWGAARYASRGEARALVTAIASGAAGIGLVVYLRWFLRKASD